MRGCPGLPSGTSRYSKRGRYYGFPRHEVSPTGPAAELGCPRHLKVKRNVDRPCRKRMNTMNRVLPLLVAITLLPDARAQEVKRNIPYADKADERQVLDVYSPKDAKNLLVVFWIHGGGWQAGDKTDVQIKPKVFMDKGFVFVSVNYRLLPSVDMATIVRDVAKSIH